MRLPRTVNAGGAVYRVSLAAAPMRGSALGYTDRDERRIVVKRGLGTGRAREVLLHEVFHAAFPGRIVDEETEEAIVYLLARSLCDTLDVRAKPARSEGAKSTRASRRRTRRRRA